MKIRYRRDVHRHEVALTGGAETAPDSYACKMIRENRIEGFLPCRTESIDDETTFLYDVTSRQPMRERVGPGELGEAMLRTFLISLRTALQELEAYLLPQDGIVLSPDCIFSDAEAAHFYFCYYPGNTCGFQEMMREMSGYILSHLCRDDRNAIMLGYSFYQICESGALTGQALGELLYSAADPSGIPEATDVEREREEILDRFFSDEEEELEGGGRRHVPVGVILLSAASIAILIVGRMAGRVVAGGGLAAVLWGVGLLVWRSRRRGEYCASEDGFDLSDPVEDSWFEEESSSIRSCEHTEDASGFALVGSPAYGDGASEPSADETEMTVRRSPHDDVSVWTDQGAHEGETTLLTVQPARRDAPRRAQLVPMDTVGGSPIRITERQSRIGKNRALCEVCLNSAAVSRMHARMEWDGTQYLLYDLRSRNGTFLNETLLEAGAPYPLEENDCIRFADMVFRYELC